VKQLGGGQTDAAVTAGDYNRFAFKPFRHGTPPNLNFCSPVIPGANDLA
jgi:hypothetical protein